MKDELLQVKNYIDDISVKGTSENFEYDFCPFLQNILDALTAEQQDNFIGELLRCKDSCLYFIARFLDFTDYNLKGKYLSSYVFCECFAKINDLECLECLYFNLKIHLMRRRFFTDDLVLSIPDIINNLYLLINHVRDGNSIDHCLKIIENLHDQKYGIIQ